jgi:hypothetical protein
MKNLKLSFIGAMLLASAIALTSCDDYLDVIPDNIATIDNAFTSRTTAEKFLFTCYSYMPSHADFNKQPFLSGDEFWVPWPQTPNYFYSPVFEVMARGNQNITDPALNYWDWNGEIKGLFQGLRDCNLFLERIDNVPEASLSKIEKERWIGEVKFLKAYYHYWLVRMYGPIPLIKENKPVSASIEDVQVLRDPVDDCFQYIVELLDEAIATLPATLERRTTEMGRATKPIAMCIKAKALVEAASPLFNGNSDYVSFTRKVDGVKYFNTDFDLKKWEQAAKACMEAVEMCESVGFELFYFIPSATEKVNAELITQMSIRQAVTNADYNTNTEAIWANPNSTSENLQYHTTATLDQKYITNGMHFRILAPPLKIAEMFYSKNGVPIDEDNDWISSGQYNNRYQLRTATAVDKYQIKEGSRTAALHFNREQRFYANLTFDQNLYFGIGKTNMDDQWLIGMKVGEPCGIQSASRYSTTGYLCKKLAHYQNNLLEGAGAGYNVVAYPWPVIRIADLYLMYAEALNEASGPSPEVFRYIDLVRERAGLEGVEDSWTIYAVPNKKNKFSTKEGLREIIQQERLIELANEGQRYWDIRRWKRAKEMWHNQPIQGWDVFQEEVMPFTRVKTIFTQQFTTRDYLWPIMDTDLSVNPNLDQNPYW